MPNCCPEVWGERPWETVAPPEEQLIDCFPRSHGISVLLLNLLYNFHKKNNKNSQQSNQILLVNNVLIT